MWKTKRDQSYVYLLGILRFRINYAKITSLHVVVTVAAAAAAVVVVVVVVVVVNEITFEKDTATVA